MKKEVKTENVCVENKLLQLIKSVCPECKTKGQVIINSNINICEKCKGKGYQTYEELLLELK